MTTQRLIVASVAGKAGTVVEALFESWRGQATRPDPAALDLFCTQMRAHGAALPVIYFAEWVDRWLMDDEVPGPGAVAGRQYQAKCLSPAQTIQWAESCGQQFPEQQWLASRLREAVAAWETVAAARVVVVVREILGGTSTDEEVSASFEVVPAWLAIS